jgi:hypothetical protein
MLHQGIESKQGLHPLLIDRRRRHVVRTQAQIMSCGNMTHCPNRQLSFLPPPVCSVEPKPCLEHALLRLRIASITWTLAQAGGQ